MQSILNLLSYLSPNSETEIAPKACNFGDDYYGDQQCK